MPEQKKCSTLIILFLFFLATVAGLAMAYHFLKMKPNMENFHGTHLKNPREVKPFQLKRSDGSTFTNQALKGQWTLFFFGFTHCGYLCPTTLSQLAKMYRLLETQNIHPLPQVVMISLDPERDSLATLDTYMKAFHSSFYGARGNEESVKQMTKEMGIAYAKVTLPASTQDPANYDIQHSGAVIVINPAGQLNAFFNTPIQAEILAKDYELLVKHA